MNRQRLAPDTIGLGVATALIGALVATSADAVTNAQPLGRPGTVAPAAPQPQPCTADTAEHWINTGPMPSCINNHALAEQRQTYEQRWARSCAITADTAEHWIRATGHPPCRP